MKVPKEVLPRFIEIGHNTFVPLEAVIARNLHELFPGMEITAHDYFRVTRDADFTSPTRPTTSCARSSRSCASGASARSSGSRSATRWSPSCAGSSSQWLGVEERQVYDIQGMLDLSDLWDIHGIDGYSELRDPPYTPVTPPAFRPAEEGEKPDLFAAMRAGDVLVHYPYESFAASVERFIEQAVDGPERARDQDDRVPDLGRLGARAVADRGRRGGQAGGLHGGAEGALRRAPQHHVGARRSRRPARTSCTACPA